MEDKSNKKEEVTSSENELEHEFYKFVSMPDFEADKNPKPLASFPVNPDKKEEVTSSENECEHEFYEFVSMPDFKADKNPKPLSSFPVNPENYQESKGAACETNIKSNLAEKHEIPSFGDSDDKYNRTQKELEFPEDFSSDQKYESSQLPKVNAPVKFSEASPQTQHYEKISQNENEDSDIEVLGSPEKHKAEESESQLVQQEVLMTFDFSNLNIHGLSVIFPESSSQTHYEKISQDENEDSDIEVLDSSDQDSNAPITAIGSGLGEIAEESESQLVEREVSKSFESGKLNAQEPIVEDRQQLEQKFDSVGGKVDEGVKEKSQIYGIMRENEELIETRALPESPKHVREKERLPKPSIIRQTLENRKELDSQAEAPVKFSEASTQTQQYESISQGENKDTEAFKDISSSAQNLDASICAPGSGSVQKAAESDCEDIASESSLKSDQDVPTKVSSNSSAQNLDDPVCTLGPGLVKKAGESDNDVIAREFSKARAEFKILYPHLY